MTRLTILHTNDIHGHVEALSRISTLVRQIRAEVEADGGHCLFLDAGDCEDTTLLESSLTKGSAMEAILRGAGCDFAALGNAVPIRYGAEAIRDLAKYFGRPLLCANLFDPNGALAEGLEPFTIETFGGSKIGIIGLTAPLKAYNSIFKLIAQPSLEILPRVVEDTRTQGAQTIILLSHLGLNDDKLIAEKTAGVDLIIGGHSHDKLDSPLVANGTIIAQAGEFGNFLGRLDLEIDSDSGKITDFKATLLPIPENVPFDPNVQSVISEQKARVDEMMSVQIGTLLDKIDLFDDRQCAAGNLLADALLERMDGAQIALVLAEHWNAALDAGALTQGTLYAAIRSTANPAKVKLRGEQIEAFLREALKPQNASRELRELRGRKVGMPHVAGLRVRYDPEDLSSVEILFDGKILEKERIYIVATTDMEIAEYINYLVIPDDEVEYEVPTIMPEVLEEYVARHSPLKMENVARIIQRAG